MTIEAAATALAPEAVSTPDIDLDAAMDEIWNKAQKTETPKIEDEASVNDKPADETPSGKAEADAEAAEAEQGAAEAPSELPRSVRDHWATLPKDAQDAILTSQREMSRKLSEQSRLAQGLAPIRDELVKLVQETPEFENMKPHEVASEMRRFRNEVLLPLAEKPVETLLKVAKDRGIEGQLAAALSGQEAPQSSKAIQQLVQTNRQLQQHIQQLNDRLNGIETRPVTETVEQFASNAEHWRDVEATITQAIAYVQSVDPNLSPKDVLQRAYDMEVQRLGKAPPAPAVEAEAQADPERTGKVLKAKSVNVSGKPSSPRAKSVDEMDDEIWRKHHG